MRPAPSNPARRDHGPTTKPIQQGGSLARAIGCGATGLLDAPSYCRTCSATKLQPMSVRYARMLGSGTHASPIHEGGASITEHSQSQDGGWAVPSLSIPELQRRDTTLRGREPIISNLQACVTSGAAPGGVDVHVLSGPEGIGTSRIAREVAFWSYQQGRPTWWVACRFSGNPLKVVERRLGLGDGTVAGTGCQDLVSYLSSSRERWLLVLDDFRHSQSWVIEDLKRSFDLRGLAENGPGGLILITGSFSTDGPLSGIGRFTQVPALDSGAGAAILRLTDGDACWGGPRDAEYLVQVLDGWPLALNLASSYLTEAARESAPKDLPLTYRALAYLISPLGTLSDKLTALVELALTLLQQRGLHDSRPMLQLLSCFAPSPIPYPLLEPGTIASSRMFTSSDRRQLGDAFHRLEDLGLVKIHAMDAQGGRRHFRCIAELHPAVRQIVHLHLTRHERAAYQDLISRLIAHHVHWFEPELEPYWPNWELLSQHCEALVGLRPIDDYREIDPHDIVRHTSPLLHAARYHLATGQYDESERYFLRVFDVRSRRLPEGDPDRIAAAHNVACVHMEQRQLEAALSELMDLLNLEERVLAQDDILLLTTRSVLARLLREQGNPELARVQLEKVLDVRLRRFGDSRSTVLRARYELALACRDAADDDTAREHLLKILRITTEESRPEDELSLRARRALAELAVKRRALAEAEGHLDFVLQWRRRILGGNHPETYSTAHDLDLVRFRIKTEGPIQQTSDPSPMGPALDADADRLAGKAMEILQGDASGTRERLEELLRPRLYRDSGWRRFKEQPDVSGASARLVTRVRLAIADTLEDDPPLRQLVAGTLDATRFGEEDLSTPTNTVGLPEVATPDEMINVDEVADPVTTATQRNVLVVAEEWASVHGGLSTFNRELCRALAEAGVLVTCFVPSATDDDRKDASSAGVELVVHEAEDLPGQPDLSWLLRRPPLPDDIQLDAVIGHGRFTGPHAKSQVTDHFTAAKRIHFLHVAPDEIEVLKEERDHSKRAEERSALELDLARSADHVIAIGPRLYQRYLTDLHPDKKPLRMDPGFDGSPVAAQMPPGNPWRVLLSGRLDENNVRLKGVDLAAKALGLSVRRNFVELPPLELQPDRGYCNE